jgi:hypothetical protein
MRNKKAGRVLHASLFNRSCASVAILTTLLGTGCGVDTGSVDEATAADTDDLAIQRKPGLGRLEPIGLPPPGGWVVQRGRGAAEQDQFRPAVATDGHDFFAVWSDRRHGLAEVYGARIAPDGKLLDEHGILIAQAPVESYDVHAKWMYTCPSVAFDGSNYLVVWSDARTTKPSVYARRIVAATGVPLDSGPIPITPGIEAMEPSVAFNGTRSLITFSVHSRVDYGGGTFEHLKLYGTFFPPESRPRGPFPLTDVPQESAWEYQARVASNGSEFAVAYSQWLDPSPDVFVVPVSAEGDVAPGLGYVISPMWGLGGTNATNPAIAFDGKNYLVAFQFWSQIHAVRLDREGVPIDALGGPALSHGPGSNATVAFNGNDYVVAWDREEQGGPTGVSNIFGVRMSREGAVTPPAFDYYFGLNANPQQHPAIAATREGELVVWQELASGDWDVRGTPVSTEGVADTLDGVAYGVE